MIRFLGRSARQAETIAAWWREHRPAAPDLFASELERTLQLIERSPEIGVSYSPRADADVRRILMPKTRYHIYFVYEPGRNLLGVLAIWSSLRGRPPSLRFFKGLAVRGSVE